MAARRFAMPAGASNHAARRRSAAEAASHAILDHESYWAADAAASLASATSNASATTTAAPAVGQEGGSNSGSTVGNMVGSTAALVGQEDGSSSGSKGGGAGSRRLLANYGLEEASLQAVQHAKGVAKRINVPYDNPPFWFSFDYGSVHFITVSTEHDLEQGSTQYAWLQADLEAVDRCKTPWVVLQLHRPLYVLYPHKSNRVVGDHLRQFLEDLLLDFKVDLCLSGHVHAYYRTCDVREQACVNDNSGIKHFVIGSAGHELSFIDDEQLEWGKKIVCHYGFMRFDVRGDKMYASFITSRDGETTDSDTIEANVYTPEDCDAFMHTRKASAQAQG